MSVQVDINHVYCGKRFAAAHSEDLCVVSHSRSIDCFLIRVGGVTHVFCRSDVPYQEVVQNGTVCLSSLWGRVFPLCVVLVGEVEPLAHRTVGRLPVGNQCAHKRK